MEKIIIKRVYTTPLIDRVDLDHEISLVMQSLDNNPIDGPDEEGVLMTPDYIKNDPYKSNLG